MILPAMGAISEIIPTFSQKHIFGYKAIIASTMAIAFVGWLVWGHHMFTAGMSGTAQYYFSLLTFIVAIPSAIKVFNWISTMYKGSINIQTPFYWAASFIFVFIDWRTKRSWWWVHLQPMFMCTIRLLLLAIFILLFLAEQDLLFLLQCITGFRKYLEECTIKPGQISAGWFSLSAF